MREIFNHAFSLLTAVALVTVLVVSHRTGEVRNHD